MASWNRLPPSSSPVSSAGPFSSPPTRSGTLLDPFSANASGPWKPPRFAKRERSPDNSPSGSPAHKRRIRESSPEPFPATSSPFGTPERKYVAAVPRSPVRESLREKEERLWENAIAQLFESGGESSIDMGGHGLTFISHDIESLAKMVRFSLPASPTLSRAASLPTNQAGMAPLRQRVSTTSTSIANHAKSGITPVQLYLSNNNIKMLPVELFRVENLTVLAIRNNKLTIIPSAIGALKNLNELVIGGNEIQFLPSEIERLPLKQLGLYPNKWLECPEGKDAGTNILSSLESKFNVPSLQELCMRTLLSFPSGSSTTVLEQDQDLKIPDKVIRPDLARYIDATCTRKVIDARSQEFTLLPQTKKENDPRWDLRYSICPNREHGIGVRKTFINPAEVRYRWVRQIGLADTGGPIPLQYRGCERGCLSFLEDEEEPGDDDIVF